eukprot:m.224770 g.224770  ORF g.224770 m.224770 type:complete len:264 (+) comp15150_c1_seq3:133-924(+)
MALVHVAGEVVVVQLRVTKGGVAALHFGTFSNHTTTHHQRHAASGRVGKGSSTVRSTPSPHSTVIETPFSTAMLLQVDNSKARPNAINVLLFAKRNIQILEIEQPMSFKWQVRRSCTIKKRLEPYEEETLQTQILSNGVLFVSDHCANYCHLDPIKDWPESMRPSVCVQSFLKPRLLACTLSPSQCRMFTQQATKYPAALVSTPTGFQALTLGRCTLFRHTTYYQHHTRSHMHSYRTHLHRPLFCLLGRRLFNVSFSVHMILV